MKGAERVTIEKIKTNICELEKLLFLHSLQQLAIEELEQMQEKVKELKEAFLVTCFVGINIAELEEMRFRLVEINCSAIIALKEQLHQNTTDYFRRFANVYRTA